MSSNSPTDDERAGFVAGDSAPLVAGQALGRFTLLRLLGCGATGEVWATRDSELDRDVALKLLHWRAASIGSAEAARLRREAQAMARLDHPNVVTIYDIGAADGRVFCAMRLIDGMTLRAWLATPRRWREVLAVMLDAGRGLAAAHAAGLVHRDIKPENILIARDGRVLVTDFGLAKMSDARAASAVYAGAAGDATDPSREVALDSNSAPTMPWRGAERAPGTLDEVAHAPTLVERASLTRTGALMGTPAYMAPEQFASEDADAATDQFALCVTIHEALFGVRPFEGETLAALALAVVSEPRRPPDARGVPARVVRCLRRGLSVDRGARWPSLAAMLDELDRVLRRRRRRVAVAAAIAATALASGVIALSLRDPADMMRGAAEAQIAAAWNPVQAIRVRAAFVTAASPVAGERADHAIHTLDAYRANWLRARLDAWSATHVRHEQTAALLERRVACFDRLSDALGELVILLTGATAVELESASQAVYRLDPVASCAQVDRLSAVSPAPSTLAGRDAERGLRELEALMRLGRHDQALARAAALVDQAQRAGDPAVVARARFNLGAAQFSSGKLTDAERTLHDAVQAAADARDHYLVAEAWLRLYDLTAIGLARPAAAAEIAPAVAAAVSQAGNDPRQLGDLAMTRGVEAVARGDFAIARDQFVQARDRHLAARGPDHPLVANAEANLGAALSWLGELDEANRALDRAIGIIRRSLGDHHPVIARAEQTLASIAAQRKDWAASERHGRASLAINEIVRGADHRETVQNRTYLARALREQRRFDEAHGELDRARDSLHRSLPPTHADVVALDLHYAALAEAEGRAADAEQLARKAVDGLRAIDAPPLRLAFGLGELARIVSHRSPRRALPVYDEALALDVRRNGRNDQSDAEELAEVARVALAARQPGFALRWFDRYPNTAARLTAERAELEAARVAGRRGKSGGPTVQAPPPPRGAVHRAR